MEYIDNVSSEGGRFLIADATIMRGWQGTEDDGSDYERACQAFSADPEPPGVLITIGAGQALAWEPWGAGTADAFRKGNGDSIISRAWLDPSEGAASDDELDALTALAALPLNNPTNLGSLEIPSGILAILWAPESGECIESLDVDDNERMTGEMAFDSSGLLVRVTGGFYTCLHDEVEIGSESARRCHLIKQPPIV